LFAGNDIRTIANLKGKTVGCEIARRRSSG